MDCTEKKRAGETRTSQRIEKEKDGERDDEGRNIVGGRCEA